jgi:hypothetical protein
MDEVIEWGISLDHVHGNMTWPRGSRSVNRIVRPAIGRSRTVRVLEGARRTDNIRSITVPARL